MFTFSVDLGQIIIAALIGIVGYFMKKTIDTLGSRLDKHDTVILDLVSDVQRLIGFQHGMLDRRKVKREE